jgi:hypothetical protein
MSTNQESTLTPHLPADTSRQSKNESIPNKRTSSVEWFSQAFSPEDLVGEGKLRWLASMCYHLGVCFVPIVGLIERAAAQQDWQAFALKVWPLVEARLELSDEIREMERKYRARRQEFFPAVERLVLTRAKKLKRAKNYDDLLTKAFPQSKPIPQYVQGPLSELASVFQAFLQYFPNVEAKPVSEDEQERARNAFKKLLRRPPGRRRQSRYKEASRLSQEGNSMHAICMKLDPLYPKENAAERAATRKRFEQGIRRNQQEVKIRPTK